MGLQGKCEQALIFQPSNVERVHLKLRSRTEGILTCTDKNNTDCNKDLRWQSRHSSIYKSYDFYSILLSLETSS